MAAVWWLASPPPARGVLARPWAGPGSAFLAGGRGVPVPGDGRDAWLRRCRSDDGVAASCRAARSPRRIHASDGVDLMDAADPAGSGASPSAGSAAVSDQCDRLGRRGRHAGLPGSGRPARRDRGGPGAGALGPQPPLPPPTTSVTPTTDWRCRRRRTSPGGSLHELADVLHPFVGGSGQPDTSLQRWALAHGHGGGDRASRTRAPAMSRGDHPPRSRWLQPPWSCCPAARPWRRAAPRGRRVAPRP